MLVKVIGLNSKKEYIRGTRDYCLRVLNEKYPSQPLESTKGHVTYPEPLIIKSLGVN